MTKTVNWRTSAPRPVRRRPTSSATPALRARIVGIADKADGLALNHSAIAKRAEARVAADLARAARDAASLGG
jgi:hypothetical protein